MRRALALRSLLGRVVHAPAAEGRGCGIATRAGAAVAAVHGPTAPLLFRADADAPLLPPLAAFFKQQQQARHNHCSCPTLKDDSDGPPRVRVAYDPADVDAFIAVADAIEDAFPSAVVEGHDGEEREQEQGERQAAVACGTAGGPAAVAAAASPFPVGGPGCEFTVTLPNGAVAFKARAAPRDAAAVLAAIRAAGGEGQLGGGEE
jgi:hypothetical protein